MPGVMRCAVIVIDPGGAIRELDRMGLPQENRPGRGELADDRAVLHSHLIHQQVRARGGRHALHVEQILRGVRDAG